MFIRFPDGALVKVDDIVKLDNRQPANNLLVTVKDAAGNILIQYACVNFWEVFRLTTAIIEAIGGVAELQTNGVASIAGSVSITNQAPSGSHLGGDSVVIMGLNFKDGGQFQIQDTGAGNIWINMPVQVQLGYSMFILKTPAVSGAIGATLIQYVDIDGTTCNINPGYTYT